jgi:triacylglycerol lipase
MRPLHWLALASSVLLVACAAPEDEEPTAEDESEIFGSAPVLGVEPAGQPARYPIVLVHGFNGSPESLGFHRVKEALERDGNVVFEARLPPFNGPEVRAKYLAKQVDDVLAANKARKVNIIGHSMGGLDARVLVSGLGYGDRVASVTTISTPHRGTYPADLALGLPGEGPHQTAMNFFASVWARTYTDDVVANDTDMRATIAAIAEKNSPAFNAKYPNDARVEYRSWAGVSALFGIGDDRKDLATCDGKMYGAPRYKADRMNFALAAVAVLVGHGTEKRPSDGAVSVESAKWGTFEGCIPADHFDEVGQLKHDRADGHTGFDHVRFYRTLASDLARSGF